jgi:hypothetical protein
VVVVVRTAVAAVTVAGGCGGGGARRVSARVEHEAAAAGVACVEMSSSTATASMWDADRRRTGAKCAAAEYGRPPSEQRMEGATPSAGQPNVLAPPPSRTSVAAAPRPACAASRRKERAAAVRTAKPGKPQPPRCAWAEAQLKDAWRIGEASCRPQTKVSMRPTRMRRWAARAPQRRSTRRVSSDAATPCAAPRRGAEATPKHARCENRRDAVNDELSGRLREVRSLRTTQGIADHGRKPVA